MAFCSQDTTVINNSNYLDKYSSATKPSCLPNGGTGFSSIGADGLVSRAAIDAQIVTLLSNATFNAAAPAVIDSRDLNAASTYATNSAALRNSINNEYCFYYKRYMFVLERVLGLASTSGMNPADTTYVKMKQDAQSINSLLNQILQIMQGLVRSRSASLNTYYGSTTGVNQLNNDLDTARKSLIEHMSKLQSNDMESNVQSSMVDYTIEKNSSSRNLLAIYGFMNIVAVGLLFYLYRSSKQ
jgi:hypothetical protein